MDCTSGPRPKFYYYTGRSESPTPSLHHPSLHPTSACIFEFGKFPVRTLDDFPQHLETQIISKPIEMTHFRQLPSLSQQFLEPPENNSGSFALVKI